MINRTKNDTLEKFSQDVNNIMLIKDNASFKKYLNYNDNINFIESSTDEEYTQMVTEYKSLISYDVLEISMNIKTIS